mgnify:CR=1 FL=1
MITIISWLSILGFLLSLYFFYVKTNQRNKNYKALCDISDTISCSKAAKSNYSSLFGFSNAILGVIFYPFIFALNFFNYSNYIFYLATISSLFSLYLIYISFRIKVACPVCITTYIINFLVLYFSYIWL